MLNTKEYRDAMVDVLEIIKYLDDDMLEKIPLDFIKLLNQKKSTTYVSTIDFTKSLEENNLSYPTKVILAYIYREFFCSSLEEKNEFNSILEKNDAVNIKTDLFNNNSNKNVETKSLITVEEDKSLFQKILDKLFKRK